MLSISRQGYYKWLKNRSRPYKHALLLAWIMAILDEDRENENYGSVRMHEALVLRHESVPSESTVRRVMRENGLIHKKKRNPQSLTKADKAAQASDDLLRRDFGAEEPNKKWVTDITQLPTHSDRGSQYTSAEFRLCVKGFEVEQSMNSAGGRCHDNAKCESMWARFKEELIYGKINTAILSMESVKALVWRYFFGYWNNRRL